MSSPGELIGGVSRTEYAVETCTVAVADWRGAIEALHEGGFTYLDWLSVTDDARESLTVLAHLVRLAPFSHVLLRAVLGTPAQVQSITPLLPGADWHEREAAEMFGVEFLGHPRPGPLLLRPGFEGHPLRKEFPLSARVDKPWPGTHEPGADPAKAARSRRRTTPPGLPEQWTTQSGPGS